MINDLNNKQDKLGSNLELFSSDGGYVLLKADNEGGNLRLDKNGHHLEMDTYNLNGTNGSARIYLGDNSREVICGFEFRENGTLETNNFVSKSTNLELEHSFSYRAAKNNGYIDNALAIDTSLDISSNYHKPYLVHKDKTKNLPGDCNRGVRLVFPTDGSVFVVIIGCDSESHNAIYLAMYTVGFGWLDTWRKLS